MTCDDYLAMLETLPVGELTYGEAREHSAVCHDCNRVTRVVAERERNMIVAYGDLAPSTAAMAVAGSAMATARRRRVASLYRIGLSIIAAAIVGIIVTSRVVPARAARVARPTPLIEQRFLLRCLTGDAAAEIVRANVPDPSRTVVKAPPSGTMLIVASTPRTMQIVRSILDQYDNQCGSPEQPVRR
jgi:hypothetical protein